MVDTLFHKTLGPQRQAERDGDWTTFPSGLPMGGAGPWTRVQGVGSPAVGQRWKGGKVRARRELHGGKERE